MSQNLNNPKMPRADYGTISSSSSNLPDVNFSGFSPTEFISLSEDIANNITVVMSSTKELEKILKIIGTPRDKQSTRDKVHNIYAKTNIGIETTSKDLQRLTSVVRRSDTKQQLQLETLKTSFRSVVEKYSAVQKSIATAIKQTYVMKMAEEQDDDDREDLIKQQQQQQINASRQFEVDMLLDRERQIRQLEADNLDVNEIMRHFSTIVHEQGENIDRIDNSIENAANDVEIGREELNKAMTSRRGYRKRMLILVLIAVIIGFIVIGILVGKLKN